jgi:hypothetical protein
MQRKPELGVIELYAKYRHAKYRHAKYRRVREFPQG